MDSTYDIINTLFQHMISYTPRYDIIFDNMKNLTTWNIWQHEICSRDLPCLISDWILMQSHCYTGQIDARESWSMMKGMALLARCVRVYLTIFMEELVENNYFAQIGVNIKWEQQSTNVIISDGCSRYRQIISYIILLQSCSWETHSGRGVFEKKW